MTGTEQAIESVLFVEAEDDSHHRDAPLALECIKELSEYFAKQRTKFSVPVAPHGTMFQQTVWSELQKIPFGAKRSYNDIAIAVGSTKMIRAVGSANARNPIAIIIPCHRVLGSAGSLTGYAGGLWRKQWLLDHEASDRSPQLFPT